MSEGSVILIGIVVLILALVGTAIWIRSKGVQAGKQQAQTDLATAQNERLQQGAQIDAKPVQPEDATDIARKLARRDSSRR